MTIYRFHAVEIPSRWLRRAVPDLTANGLAASLAGAAVRSVLVAPNGGYHVEVEMDRPSYNDALIDIASSLETLGLDVAEMVIIEYATSWIEGAVLGAVGGAGVIGTATKDPAAAVVGAIVGIIVGAAVGNATRRVRATYEGSRVRTPLDDRWRIEPIELPGHSGRVPYLPFG